MSYNTKQDTITVNEVTYDVDRSPNHQTGGERLTLMLDGEEVFEGLVGTLDYEQWDMSMHNPRDWSNVGTMAVSYRDYDLGDEKIDEIDFEKECHHCDGTGETVGPENLRDGFLVRPPNCPYCEGVGMVPISPVDYFKQEHGARVVLGLTVYEHSGITMYAGNVTLPFDSDRWDTSFVGFIYDTPEKVKECIGDNATDEQIEEALHTEVKVYASYLEGDVTWYSVEDEETDFHDGCGGYVGDSDYCESECFAALETGIVKRLLEMAERKAWAERDVMTED